MLKVELNYLFTFANLVNADVKLGLRIEIKRCNFTFSEFNVNLIGIKFPVKENGKVRFQNEAVVHVKVPSGYPFQANPILRFFEPIPFHPHIYTNGEICFGDLNIMIDYTLLEWLLLIFEILSYRSKNSIFKLSGSLANSEAYDWLKLNGAPNNLDISRLRNLAYRILLNKV